MCHKGCYSGAKVICGTVPITPEYNVDPWYNSATGSFYGYDGMCENFWRIIDAHEPYVDPNEMPNGRQLVPGWFSWSGTIEYGLNVGATPNGRRSGEPISHGANPNPKFRGDGAPTAQSNGIASVQCGYGNTAPLQIKFDPNFSADEERIDIIERFILGHFEQGGNHEI